MNNEALILIDALCEDAQKILSFIQTKTKGLKGEEHEILDTFPILYIRETQNSICQDLAPYISEELTFEDGANIAGQSYEEILELLDTTDVYVCGSTRVDDLCRHLSDAGLATHLL